MAQRKSSWTATRKRKLSEGPDGEVTLPETAQDATAAAFKAELQRFQFNGAQTGSSPPPKSDPLGPPPSTTSRKRTLSENDQDEPSAPMPSASPSPAKKRRETSRYAPPSRYSHLPKLLDVLEPNLICVFVGTNPGIATATAGHAYAHPSNLFWKLLHASGCTDVRLPPEMDVDLPKLYSMGNTNIVERPSKDAAELSKTEMAAGTPILEEKVRAYKPEAVCLVGKGIWEAVWRWRYKREIRKEEFKWGWQDEKESMGQVAGQWTGAKVFVSSSTSGLSASLRPHEKEAIWKPFGEWVKTRRKERFGTEGRLQQSDQQESHAS